MASEPLLPLPAVPPPASDPPPREPERPLPAECCESGCDPCVYDTYAEELAWYRSELAAWQARNPGCDPGAG